MAVARIAGDAGGWRLWSGGRGGVRARLGRLRNLGGRDVGWWCALDQLVEAGVGHGCYEEERGI